MIMEKGYVYYMTQRPPSPGAMPRKGLVDMKDFGTKILVPILNIEAWGKIIYDRPLTDDEIWNYELTRGGVIEYEL